MEAGEARLECRRRKGDRKVHDWRPVCRRHAHGFFQFIIPELGSQPGERNTNREVPNPWAPGQDFIGAHPENGLLDMSSSVVLQELVGKSFSHGDSTGNGEQNPLMTRWTPMPPCCNIDVRGSLKEASSLNDMVHFRRAVRIQVDSAHGAPGHLNDGFRGYQITAELLGHG